jgi:hypothetical protein
VCARRVFKIDWSHILITFTEATLKLKKYPHEDPLVIRAVLGKNTKYFREDPLVLSRHYNI